MSAEYTWAVFERGFTPAVASGSGRSFTTVKGECVHYALQYGMDGPVTFWVKKGRKKLASGSVTPADGEVMYAEDAT